MKLIIQIPCFNEEATLPATLADLPRDVPGFAAVEWLVIDDGSTDKTVQVARDCGVDHIVKVPANRGLANAFSSGISECLLLGADVIVNTDADNQYDASGVLALVRPIIDGQADMVIGERPITDIDHFSKTKKFLQRFGSTMVRKLSGTNVKDAPSGFRAFSRSTAMRLNVFGKYTYTLETIIQAGQNGLTVLSVPVGVNDKTRESRLVKSTLSYVRRSAVTMLRFFVIYRPMRFFLSIGSIFVIGGMSLFLRFFVYYLGGDGSGHIQSLILAALLSGIGVLLWLVALIVDLVAVNRRLLEKLQWKLYQLEDSVAKGCRD